MKHTKKTRGFSVISAACIALTGLTGALPVLPAPAAVYAAESSEKEETQVSAEMLQFCKDALGVLDHYQVPYYSSVNGADGTAMYFYGSELLKKEGKKGAVPLSEMDAVLTNHGFKCWNLQSSLEKMTDGSNKPVFDSEKQTVTLFADTYEENPLKTRILSVQDIPERGSIVVDAAVCTEESGDPAALDLIEFADYCDYDPEKKTYYLIGQPVRLEIDKRVGSDGKTEVLRVSSYEKTDTYTAGGKLYALMHSDTENLDYKMSYSPVEVKVQFQDAETGELTALKEWNWGFGPDNQPELRVYNTLGNIDVLFPKEDTRLEKEMLWKTEAGEFTYNLKADKGCSVTVTCEDAKGKQTVQDGNVKSEGAAALTFTIKKDPAEIKTDTLSEIFNKMYFYDALYGSSAFKEGENAPDRFVIARINDELYDSPLRPQGLSWEDSYTVPYKSYIEYADKLFAKHSDLKKELGKQYDSKADTVTIPPSGGAGGFSGTNLMIDYTEQDDIITVRGLHARVEGPMTGWWVPEDATEYYDYYKETDYKGDTFKYGINEPLELKLRKTENGYQYLAYGEVSSVRFGDRLHTRIYEKEPHDYNTVFTKMVYTAVTVTVLDNKTGLPVEVRTTLDDKGNFTAATADGKIKLTVADGIETLYDGIGWRFPINPLTFTVTGDCTVTGINGKELKAAGKDNTYELAAKDGGSEIVLTIGEAPEKGDVSGNGEVGIEDAQNTLIAYTELFAGNDPKLTPAQMTAADVNGDGDVSVEDAQYILLYYTENNVAGNAVTWEQLLGK